MLKAIEEIGIIVGIMFLLSPPCFGSTWCPRNEEVTFKIEELATNDKVTLDKETYHLIGRDKTSIFLSGKFLENSTQLEGFLKVSRLLDKNLNSPEAHLIRLLPTPNFCAYRISLGKSTQFIALSTAS
ncbi:MAG: hypothetical protein FJX71_06935 [Alphaproteobacteria bacterium]|nr:hypothetical protein [Alphaproteobacteria bacterium]